MQSFTSLAVLFPDCQKLTYVKRQNVALPFELKLIIVTQINESVHSVSPLTKEFRIHGYHDLPQE